MIIQKTFPYTNLDTSSYFSFCFCLIKSANKEASPISKKKTIIECTFGIIWFLLILKSWHGERKPLLIKDRSIETQKTVS
jgi:hypothetical protein